MGSKIETLHEMIRAGYKLRNNGVCKGCGAAIQWWTTNNNRLMPFDPSDPADGTAIVTLHASTCPRRDQFKSRKDIAQDTAKARTEAVAALQRSSRARAVIALYDEGPILAWADGLNAEDTRNEAIAAANKLRWQIATHPKEAR